MLISQRKKVGKNERNIQDGNGSAGGDHLYFDFAVVSEVEE